MCCRLKGLQFINWTLAGMMLWNCGGLGIGLASPVTGSAELELALQQDLAQPLALASADFDEDGVADLVTTYAGENVGILTLHRGNIDSIYPNSFGATQRKASGEFVDSPFLPHARTFEVQEAPEFVGAGDFDADGHWDIATTARGSNKLYLFRGDGRGGFGRPEHIDLSGTVTSFVSGEINRPDGLTDLVVGITEPNGPQCLVFEGPEGALRSIPEVFALPSEPTDLAVGQLDDDYPMDLAVAAGNNLVLVQGRDRRLSLDEASQAAAPPAKMDQHSFPFSITSIAVGDFVHEQNYQTEIALLADQGAIHLLKRTAKQVQPQNDSVRPGARETPTWRVKSTVRLLQVHSCQSPASECLLVAAKVSTLPGDELLLLDPSDQRLHILTADNAIPSTSVVARGEPIAVLPMRLNANSLTNLVMLKKGQSAPSIVTTVLALTTSVTNTNDSGPGSFREALSLGGTINFDIPASDPNCDPITHVCTITLLSSLPEITAAPGGIGPVTIDGTTQPGFAGTPIIVLKGGLSIQGLKIAAGNSVVRGLVINGFISSPGITLTGGGNNIIEGNYIGIGPGGAGSPTTTGNNLGIEVINSSNNLIGGTTAAARNIIAANTGHSIQFRDLGVTTGNLIQGNYLGTNSTGTARGNTAGDGFTNGSGVRIINLTTGNTIGGTTAGARNVISGQTAGVSLGPNGSNLVQGNYIGTDFTGTISIGNKQSHVIVQTNGSSHMVGGTTPAARNILSGGTPLGVSVSSAPTIDSNLVQGNFIGTQVDGTSPLANQIGVNAGSGAIIGGTVSGAGNVIAFNTQAGVRVNLGVNPILSNSIHSNGGLGIDILNDGVTLNDLGDSDTGPNNLQNFPVITSATSSATDTTITGTLNSLVNTTFRIELFSNNNCDASGNGEGQTFIGSTTITTDSGGNANFSETLSIAVPAGQFITATATDPTGNTSEFSQCLQASAATPTPTPTPTPVTLQFSAASYSVVEDCTSVTVTITRSGPVTGVASVDYATANATASERSDYTTALGTLRFAAGETSKTFDLLINEDSSVEGTETATVMLSNPAGAILGSPAIATLEIVDDPMEPSTNPVDDPVTFVCQHYHDFLNRQPDAAGLGFWTNQITQCGSDSQCIELKRINVSAAFFLSIEFQETGYLVYRFHQTAFGAGPLLRLRDFLADTQEIGRGVEVGAPGWGQQLEANKQAYANGFAARPQFAAQYSASMSAAQFVDALNANTLDPLNPGAGGSLSPAERDQLVSDLTSGAKTRAEVVRSVAEDADFRLREFNRAFVYMQYVGYLRRNADAPPDNNLDGYNFWLGKLNQFNGNFVQAEMVKSFLVSSEYRGRFAN